jgi:HAD superfamily hydrolase (TIGR01509 family)
MSLPRPPKAVVFDMDGLLVDTEVVYREAMLAAALADGLEFPDELFRSLIGLSWPANAEILQGHYGPRFDPEAFKIETVRRFHDLLHAGVALKAGVLEILDLLDEIGIPRGVATSSGREAVDHHLGGHGLLDRFHAIKAAGDYVRAKPAPDPYLAAAEALGVPPEHCLALEDSHNGVRAAAAAGMMTIMVPDLLDPTEEMRSLCIRIARDLHEVLDLIRATG